jgi:glutamate racemase
LKDYIGNIDALVLGCTHYPFAAEAISRVLGEQVALLDGGDGTARETKRRLALAGLLNDGSGEIVIENSSADPKIIELAYRLLNE